MRAALLAAAAVLGLAGTAQADIISTLGFTTNANSSTLTLVAVPPPGNQPTNNPCIICGTNQPGQPANFGFNNYKQSGGQTAFSVFSTAVTPSAQLDTNVQGTPYLASFLRAFLISQLDLNGTLNVGIDVNTGTGQGPEVLERFSVLDTVNHVILADYNPAVGTPLPTANNGSGFPDYILSGFNIDRADIQPNTNIEFYARWSNASDGAESFFVVPVPGQQAVPEPASLALLGMGLLGLSVVQRRKHQP